jgi:predicted ATPase/signal transduction histidine kinase
MEITAIEKIYSGEKIDVFKARENGRNVVVKAANHPYPSPETLALLETEYSMLKDAGGDGVVDVHAVGDTPVGYGIVMEDFGGRDLTHFAPVDVATALRIGAEAAKALARIHAKGIVHKDVNPQNILYNPETDTVKIIDFNAAGRIRNESVSRTERPVGTPAYMSPEQTGRMNRYLDHRTDFYSLGATLYFLLSGRPPFVGKDVAELIHAHVALSPQPLHRVNPKVPKPVSDLVHKLLAKNAEERYHTAEGLAQDLEYCRAHLDDLKDFVPGMHDAPREFRPPQKLYGRETELQRLFEAFESVCVTGQSAVVTITGESGIGKSALIHEVQKPLVREKGYFVAGKYDQYQRNVPFNAVAQALKELVRQILTETPERIEKWKTEILAALGTNAKVVCELVPELEWLVGPQPDVPRLAGNEALNRARYLFGQFVKVFALREHPLVVFLDDVQWADLASLQWLENQALEPPPSYMLLIVAYRDNEVGDDHPLRDTLKTLKEAKKLVELRLENLTVFQIEQLLNDALGLGPDGTFSHAPLAELIRQKTAGNPFFVSQFLVRLFEQNILRLEGKRWVYDLAAAQSLRSSDNVVEFLLDKLHSLPESALSTLQTAALLGAAFDESTLSEITGITVERVREQLNDLARRDLIVKSGDVFRFQHDRIHQAAYQSLAPERARELHWLIARRLADRPEKLFDAVGHYRAVLDLLTAPDERVRAAKLFLAAGKKARDAAAFDSGLQFLETCIALLPENAWHSEFDAAFSAHTLAGECAFLVGDADKADRHYDAAIARTPSDLFRLAKVYKLKIDMYAGLGKHDQAIALGSEMLRKLGFRFPYHLRGQRLQLTTVAALIKAKWHLRNKTDAELENAPECHDAKINLMREIVIFISAPVFLGVPELLPANTLWQIPYWLKFGPSESSAFNVMGYALVLNVLGDLKNARRFGDVGLKLYRRFEGQNPALDAKIYSVDLIFNQPLRAPLPTVYQSSLEHFKRCRELGEATFGRYTWHAILYAGMTGSVPLQNFEENLSTTEVYYAGMKDDGYVVLNKIARKYACVLMDRPMDYFFPERATYAKNEKQRSINPESCTLLADVMLALFEMNDAEITYENILGRLAAELHMHSATAMYFELVLGEAILRMRLEERTKKPHGAAKAVRLALRRLGAAAAVYAENWAARHHLLKAEWLRFSGKTLEAEKEYDLALEAAKKANQFHVWGLAGEWAAAFYLNQGLERAAQGYLREAHYAYGRWGATALTRRLEDRHPFLFPSAAKPARAVSTVTTVLGAGALTSTGILSTTTTGGTSAGLGTSTGVAASLDFDSIIKATQALSMEVNLSALLDKLMRTVMENAGAEKGVLLLQNDESKLSVQAAARADGVPYPYTPGTAIDQLNDLPRTVVYFVFRTGTGAVLSHAAREGDFVRDEYIAAHGVKSVLCTPVLNRGAVVGVLYLENNLTPDAFTPQRIETVQLIAAQAGISIENARLYENLERKVEIRTKELSDALVRLKETQDELIRTEKMASVGKLVKNVSHEINSPLGAIKSSSETMKSFLQSEARQVFSLYRRLPETQVPAFDVLLQKILDPVPPATTRELRRARKELSALTTHLTDGDVYADALAGIGFTEVEKILPLLDDPTGREAVDAAIRFTQISLSVHNILQAEARTEKIVQTLRTLATIDDSFEAEVVELKPALDAARQTLSHSLTYGVDFALEGLPFPKVLARRGDVEKVLSHLLHNAYQWSGASGKVTVEFHELINDEGKFVVTQVRDQGPGVEEARRSRLFEPFYSTLPEGQGSGLGLYLSKLIVEKYGGKIRLHFPSEGGTVAEFALPAAE